MSTEDYRNWLLSEEARLLRAVNNSDDADEVAADMDELVVIQNELWLLGPQEAGPV